MCRLNQLMKSFDVDIPGGSVKFDNVELTGEASASIRKVRGRGTGRLEASIRKLGCAMQESSCGAVARLLLRRPSSC